MPVQQPSQPLLIPLFPLHMNGESIKRKSRNSCAEPTHILKIYLQLFDFKHMRESLPSYYRDRPVKSQPANHSDMQNSAQLSPAIFSF